MPSPNIGSSAMAYTVELLPSAAGLLELHTVDLPQKDDLCGAFWGMLVLQAAGYRRATGGGPIDQDALAAAAGTTISRVPDPRALPPRETGRRDYRLDLPLADDPDRSGTSAAALARAVHELSGGGLRAVPAAGPWDPASVRAVVEVAREPDVAGLIANITTSVLWGSRPRPADLLRHLATGTLDGPRSDWSVGHFVAVLGSVEGRAGSLLLLADTYVSLGWCGVHAQPLELVAAALHRDGDGAGGALLMTAGDAAAGVEARLREAGLEVRHWDNRSDDVAGR